jgi:purine-cytosine permease-like protein
MSIIIAGHFQLQDEVEQARRALVDAGFDAGRVSGFYVNQPGQHDMTPVGGDHQLSPGAKETPTGVVEGVGAGAAVGVAIGAATSPVTGPLGPVVGGLLGAHVGSLFSFSKMKEAGESENAVEPRKAGMLVAVAFDDPALEAGAVDLLRRLGAHHLERARGNIVDGDWADFDPGSVPDVIA